MNIKNLGVYFDRLEKEPSRIKITEILAELFNDSDSEEIDKIVYLSLGQLGPKYEGLVLNLADKMMVRVISEVSGKKTDDITKEYKTLGDIGNVAQKFCHGEGKITVPKVFEKLLLISKDSGEKSQERKVSGMSDLLKELDPLSARFVARIPVGKLRLGFSDKTILDGLSWMIAKDKSKKSSIENAYRVLPDPGALAKRIKTEGLERAVANISPKVGVPVEPMLAQRLKSAKEMIEKMHTVAVEPKLDGLRLSIHIKKGNGRFIKAFTRNMNETSWMFPELINAKEEVLGNEVILDCEAVGLDSETKLMANFQTTMTRRRKHDISEVSKKTSIEFFVFDVIFKDGKNLMNEDYLTRRKVLESTVLKNKTFRLVENLITQDPKIIEEEYAKMRKKGLEGVIVKKVDSKYVPGRLGFRWVKMKQVESAKGKLSDTIDGVVMGYSLGKGKRAGFGLGQFLVGIVDGEKILTITKVGSGLSDEEFKSFSKKLKENIINSKPKEYEVHKNYTPDYWVEPKFVVELAGDDMTKSPTHTSGYALRFPRVVKFREDRNPKDATNLDEVKELFKIQ